MNERALSVALTFLLVVSSFSVAGAGPASAAPAGNDATSFHVTQGGECYDVEPIGDGSQSVVDFYDYRSNETHPNESEWRNWTYSSWGTTHLQENQGSKLFVYDGSEGYSLVLLHDKFALDGGDGSGATTITFTMSGMSNVSWAVRDDTYGNDTQDDNWNTDGPVHEIDWMWANNRTDGGAARDIQGESITIEPAFNENASEWGEWPHSGDEDNRTESWDLIYGDETEQSLDMGRNVTVETGSCPDETSPDADLTANPSTVGNDESVTLDASGSTDDGGSGIAEYKWDFTDNGEVDRTTETASVEHTYESPGEYTASVTVVDEAGNEDTATAEVTVTDQSESNITFINATAVEVEGSYGTVQLDVSYYTDTGIADSTPAREDVSGTTLINLEDEYGVNGSLITNVALYEDDTTGEPVEERTHPRSDHYSETIKPYAVNVSVEDVTETDEGTYDVTFGYDSPNDESLDMRDSTLSGNVSGDAPEVVEPGENTFTVTWTPDSDDERATWTLDQTNFAREEVSASTKTAGELGDGDDGSPTVSSFTVRSQDNETVSVSFHGSASITDVEASVEDEDGNHVATLTEDDFAESDAGDYVNYSATTTVEQDGTYVATLTKAADSDGNDAADGQTGQTYVGPLDGSIEFVDSSTAEVTGEFERVWVYETWYDEYAPVTDQYYLENVSGTTTIESPDAGINGSAITSIAVEKHANDGEYDRQKENPYRDEAKPYSANLSVESVTETDEGTYDVTFGYDNRNDGRMFVEDSQFTTGNVSGEPPETLYPDENTTTVTWTPDSDDERVTWTVNQSNFDLDDASASTKTAGEYNGSGDGDDSNLEADLMATPTEGYGETEFTFDASDSSGDEGIDEYRWDFDGDGEFETTTDGPETSRNYSEVGSHEVTLQVADAAGNTDTTSTNVTVYKVGSGDDEPPTAELSVPDGSMSQLLYPFDATESTDDDEIVWYQWDVDGDGEVDWKSDGPKTSIFPFEEFDGPGTYEATVTVIDSANQTDTATAEFTVEKVLPKATIDASSETVEVGEEVTFNAKNFNKAPDTLKHICWKVGDEEGPDGQTWTTSFEESGQKTIKLVLRDRAGHEHVVEKSITVTAADDNGDDGGNDKEGGYKDDPNEGNKGGGLSPADPDNGNDGDDPEDGTVSAPLNGDDAEMGKIALVPAADADPALEVSQTAPASVEAPSVAEDGFEALSYVTVSDADSATITVSKDRLDAADATADDVTLFRYENGTWTAVETEQLGETDDAFEFEADATDATYAVGIDRPATSVTDLAVENQRVEPGETVTVLATVENDGRADGTHEVELTVGGDVVATETVSVGASETAEVSLTHAFDDSGVYDVSVEGEQAEVVVEGIETSTTDDSSGVETSESTSDDDSTGGVPGFGVGVSLVALLGAALLALRRQ